MKHVYFVILNFIYLTKISFLKTFKILLPDWLHFGAGNFVINFQSAAFNNLTIFFLNIVK